MPPRVDDRSIADDEILWRRIIPEWLCREADGTIRPGKVAFIDRLSGEVSVHIASILGDPNLALRGRPADSLAAIKAGHPRSLGLAVVRDPKPDDPSHALLCPSPTPGKARQIAKQAVWVVLRNPPSP
jgi:hypothetical protein